MGKDNLKNLIAVLWLLLPGVLLAQPNDCRRAIVICDDRPITFTPQFGAGIDDFLGNNSKGCLERKENISVWFYFEFRKDMPRDYGISFTLTDSVRIRGQDYDFAIYGPDLTCDSLGAPIRCSFAQINPNERVIRTGLGRGATDTSEGLDGDGFVDSMIVQPGQGFFMIIDFFVGIGGVNFDSTLAQSFRLVWGGRAAPYLNCIANPNCDLVMVDARPDTTVCAGTTLSIEVNATNTNGGASVRWSALGEANSFIEAPDSFRTRILIPPNASGLYSFIATIGEGNCEHSDEIAVNVLPLPRPEITGVRIICPGQNVTLRGSPGFSAYRWSTGVTADTALVAQADIYALTVTDRFGCQGTDTFEVRTKDLPPPRILGDTILCPGETTFLVTDSGYARYIWNNGADADTISTSTPGIYAVTLTDSDGCFASTQVEVIGIRPQSPVISGQDYFCAGGQTLLRVSPAFATYQWSDGSSADSLVIRQEGAYALTVTDAFGCPSTGSVPIIRRENPIPALRGDTLFCSGSSTLLQATPGFAAYRWSNSEQDSVIRVDLPGSYSVTVIDDFGCAGAASIRVDTLPLPKPAITGPSTLCEGEFARISPGTFQFYSWSTGEIFPDIRVDSSGLYSVTVTGSNGCTASDSFRLTVFPNPVPVISGPLTLCPDTFLVLSASPGLSGYLWSSGDTTVSLRVDQPGNYGVVVVDGNGCRGETFADVVGVPAPVMQIQGDSLICEGDTATLQATPGFATYFWSTGAATDRIQVSQNQVYSVTIIDSNGCVASDTANLRVLANPPVAIGGPVRFCAGSFTTLSVPSGYIRYNWSTSAQDSSIRVSQPGRYQVTVTTSEGCSRISGVDVMMDIPVLPQLQPGNYRLCEEDTVRFEAGPGFVSYRWSDGSTLPFLEVTREGRYSLTVVDSNSCTTGVTVDVSIIPVIPPVILGPDSFCQGTNVRLFAVGTFYTSYLWSTNQTLSNIDVSQGGTYRVTVTDANGCRTTASKTVGMRPAPGIQISGDLEICRGDSTVLSVPGGFGSYSWTTGSGDTAIVVRGPGTFGVLVLGINGCIGGDEVVVRQSRIPFPIIDGDRFFCTNDSVALEVEAGFEGYTWSTGQTGNRIFVNKEGTYGITVTDDLGCEGRAQVRVLSTPSPDAQIDGRLDVCPGDSTRLTAVGNFPEYRWSADTSNTAAIWARAPGWYVLEVRADNNCRDRDSVLVVPAAVPQPRITGLDYFCRDSSALIAVADTFASIRWSTGVASRQITVRQPGDFSVEVRNARGCIGRDTLEMRAIDPPLADAGRDTILTCDKRSVTLGRIPGSPVSGVVALWEGPGINAANRQLFQPSVGVPGLYTVVLRDTVHGCPSLPSRINVSDVAYMPEVAVQAEDTLDCITSAVFLNGAGSAAGPALKYAWRDMSRGIDLSSDSLRVLINAPGAYVLTVLDTLYGCRNSRTFTASIDTLAPVPAVLDPARLNCVTDSVVLQAASPPQGQMWAFSWSNPPGAAQLPGPRFTVGAPGEYRLQAQNLRNGCFGEAMVAVEIDTVAPLANGGPDQELDCLSLETTLSGEVPDNQWNYQWRDAATGFILSRRPEFRVELPGIYLFEVINTTNGCQGVDTVRVLANTNLPEDLALDVQPETCAGRGDGRVRVLEVAGGEGPFVFRLSGTTSFSAADAFNNLVPGTYRITLQDANGCELTRRFDIAPGLAATLNLGDDLYIKLGDQVRLVALTNIAPGALDSLVWTRPDTLQDKNSPELNLRPLGTTEYAAFVRDTNGCAASDAVTIFVDRAQRVYFPNAFSPNGDGSNDVYMVFSGPDVVKIKSLRLYNRWGTSVYERADFPPNDPAFGWDGVHRGVVQNPGVYVYYAEVEFLDGTVEPFKGDFTLVR